MEASMTAGGGARGKQEAAGPGRPVPDDAAEFFDGGEYEPTFVAGRTAPTPSPTCPRGSIHCGHEVGERCPRMRAFDADDERSTALLVRVKSKVAAAIRDMEAAAAAAPLGRVVVG